MTALVLAFLVLLGFGSTSWARANAAFDADLDHTSVEMLRGDIAEMKNRARGPFERLRWFCNDGTVHPPKPYPCAERGGGRQHGEYTQATQRLRDAGYPIANFLVETDPKDVLRRDSDLLQALLLEQFLIGYDDGWILRKARFYRGAFQVEDEEAAGQALLERLAAQDNWVRDRFLLLREAVRLLPHEQDRDSIGEIRGLAAAFADLDEGFRPLRGKIHGRPEASDAERVLAYAEQTDSEEMKPRYLELAAMIDRAYAPKNLGELLDELEPLRSLDQTHDRLDEIHSAARRARHSQDRVATLESRVQAATGAMALIREALAMVDDPADRVQLLDASLRFEQVAFTSANRLASEAPSRSRSANLRWLHSHALGLFGSGLLSAAELGEIELTLENIEADTLTLSAYRIELEHLGRASQWANNRLLFHFADTMARFFVLEPKVEQFPSDRLRGSLMLPYDALHEVLAMDAQMQVGMHHEVFGRRFATGLRSLNPGLARGTLYVATADLPLSDYDAHGIYLVPETIAKLPPVAGVLTRSEGNALSHVQLLARNLGIPNIVISDSVAQKILPHVGESIVIAGSHGGVVHIARDSFEWDNVFHAGEEAERAPIRVDVEKLDLQSAELRSLDSLRASDSGRIAGPKAAKLGELHYQFPGRVAPGVVIPFGIYRQLLEQPVDAKNPEPMRAWLLRRYAELGELKRRDLELYRDRLETSLAFVRSWFQTVAFPTDFETELRAAFEQSIGDPETHGVFVRSDTNVEDLDGFTGAGLNLTVHNVVGFDEILTAVRQVWASPFTTRAFGWRQAVMDRPEHVYASVLLQLGVPAEKSGVLVTKDLDSGSRQHATVVVNHGVGGGVDGQRAETLVFSLRDAQVRRRTSATATTRRVLLPTGGSALERITGTGPLLTDTEIEALRELAQSIPIRVPEFARGSAGEAKVADVEFGFADGQLWLFQIRPLVDFGGHNRSAYLNALDAGLDAKKDVLVALNDLPLGPRS